MVKLRATVTDLYGASEVGLTIASTSSTTKRVRALGKGYKTGDSVFVEAPAASKPKTSNPKERSNLWKIVGKV